MAANDNRRRKKIEAQRAKRKDKQRAIARVESSSKTFQEKIFKFEKYFYFEER